ncbi:MAG TPA: hypothetical protein VFV65_02040, partial [Gemmatimonadales bacterium]|nr:hypothetical protein [Gemmatimonadales bacterium]
ALAVALCYIGSMFVLGRLTASQVRFELTAAGVQVRRVLAAPLPLRPLAREIVVEEGNSFLVGEIRTGGQLQAVGHWPKWPAPGDLGDPAVAFAATTPDAATFLGWARFPTYLVDRRGGATVVHFIDLRYAREPEARFGTLSVLVSSGSLVFGAPPPPR